MLALTKKCNTSLTLLQLQNTNEYHFPPIIYIDINKPMFASTIFCCLNDES